MKRYQVSNLIFTPEATVKLSVDGRPIKLEKKAAALLHFFLKHAGIKKSKNEILDEVWGEGEHTHKALTSALTKVRKVLPDKIYIDNLHNEGYIFDHYVEVSDFKHAKIEEKLANSKEFNRLLVLVFSCTFLVIFGLGIVSVQIVQGWMYPTPHYVLDNRRVLFARDYIVGTAQLSPDGRYVAHRLSTELFVDDKLGLLDLTYGDTRPIMPLGFLDGFEWDLTGDRIVYQDTTNGGCEIMLLTFTPDKSDKTIDHLTSCAQKSGQLSFAWFNENEFYVNFVAEGAKPTLNNFPLHHLYSFNVNTKKTKLVKKAEYQGGVGFYSLEFDPSTGILYFLQTQNFKTTDFYQYANKTATKIGSVKQRVGYYAVGNHKLVYKDHTERLVINSPPSNFSNQQVLVRPQPFSLHQPQFNGNQLIYMMGDPYSFSLQRWHNNQLSTVNNQNFVVDALAAYNGQLVFSAKVTGIFQLYLLTASGEAVKISDMKTNQHILHIEVVGDIFVLSFVDRVEIYRLNNNQLVLKKSLPGFTDGVMHSNGKTLLVKTKGDKDNSFITELTADDYQPTGRQVANAILAFYHNDQIVYLNSDYELYRFKGDNIIAKNIKVDALKYTDLDNNHFYYIAKKGNQSQIFKVDLITEEETTVEVNEVNPRQMQMVNDSMYIRSRQALKPKLITGQLTTD